MNMDEMKKEQEKKLGNCSQSHFVVCPPKDCKGQARDCGGVEHEHTNIGVVNLIPIIHHNISIQFP